MKHFNCKIVYPKSSVINGLKGKMLIVSSKGTIRKGELIYYGDTNCVEIAPIGGPAVEKEHRYKVIATAYADADESIPKIEYDFVRQYENNLYDNNIEIESCTIEKLHDGMLCIVNWKNANKADPITLHCPIVGSYSLLGIITSADLTRKDAEITILFDQILPGIDLAYEVITVLKQFPNVKIVKK